MVIRLAHAIDKEIWNTYVQNHPDASAYHFWAWKEAIAEAYAHKGYYFIAEQEGRICGVLPLVQMKLPLLQNQLVGLPYCDVGGPLADNSNVSALLLNEAALLRNKLGSGKLEVRVLSSERIEFSNYATKGTDQWAWVSNKVSMRSKLPGSSEELWSGFKSKLRSQISKAEKNGLIFRWGNLQDIAAFYSVFSENMHELGSPVHSKAWITSVLTHYGEKAKVGLVFFDHQPIGCGVILICGKTVVIPWASTLRKFNKLGPNMLLYWNFLSYSANNAFEIFDFGRSTPGEGTYRFKSQWGAEPRTLYWRTLQSSDRVTPKDLGKLSSDLNRERLAALWRKLPLCAANLLGPILRRHISL